MKPEQLALALVDQDGMPFDLARLPGRPSLVYFGFLHCRSVCPRTLAKLAEVLDRLGSRRGDYRILYISVDPARDTPEAFKAFLADRPSEFVGLTGTEEAIDAAKASMRVYARRSGGSDQATDYAVPHTAMVYLVDDRGRYLAHFPDGASAAEIAQRLLDRDVHIGGPVATHPSAGTGEKRA